MAAIQAQIEQEKQQLQSQKDMAVEEREKVAAKLKENEVGGMWIDLTTLFAE